MTVNATTVMLQCGDFNACFLYQPHVLPCLPIHEGQSMCRFGATIAGLFVQCALILNCQFVVKKFVLGPGGRTTGRAGRRQVVRFGPCEGRAS